MPNSRISNRAERHHDHEVQHVAELDARQVSSKARSENARGNWFSALLIVVIDPICR